MPFDPEIPIRNHRIGGIFFPPIDIEPKPDEPIPRRRPAPYWWSMVRLMTNFLIAVLIFAAVLRMIHSN